MIQYKFTDSATDPSHFFSMSTTVLMTTHQAISASGICLHLLSNTFAEDDDHAIFRHG